MSSAGCATWTGRSQCRHRAAQKGSATATDRASSGRCCSAASAVRWWAAAEPADKGCAGCSNGLSGKRQPGMDTARNTSAGVDGDSSVALNALSADRESDNGILIFGSSGAGAMPTPAGTIGADIRRALVAGQPVPVGDRQHAVDLTEDDMPETDDLSASFGAERVQPG